MSAWKDISTKMHSTNGSILEGHGKLSAESFLRDAPPDLEMKFVVTIAQQINLPEGEQGFSMTCEF